MAARVLDLAALRSFVAIVETRSVTRAASALNLTQSAVSMQLKRLEEALGQPLMVRERRAMSPTLHGEQLLSYARRMLDLNDEVWARMRGEAFEGRVVLGVPHDIVYPHIPEVLRQFARAFPRVDMSLVSQNTTTLKEMFAKGEADVILTTETRPDGGASVLEESPLVWIGAPDGQAWRQRPLPLAFEDDCIFRPWVQEALDEAGIPWTMAVSSPFVSTVDAVISADFGVHAALHFTVQRRYDVIDHGGALPALPRTKVALYAAKGPGADLAQRLAQVLREVWGQSMAPAIAVAAE